MKLEAVSRHLVRGKADRNGRLQRSGVLLEFQRMYTAAVLIRDSLPLLLRTQVL